MVKSKPLQVDILRIGDIADGGFHRVGLALAALQDPLQHPQVVAEARPDEVALVIRYGTS